MVSLAHGYHFSQMPITLCHSKLPKLDRELYSMKAIHYILVWRARYTPPLLPMFPNL